MTLLHRSSRPARGLALTLICAALVLGGCSRGGAAAGGDLPVLKVADQKGTIKAVMLASHALDGAPYRVEWSEFPSAQTLLEALGAGAVDAGGAGDAPFLFAYANNPKLKVAQIYRLEHGGRSVAVIVGKNSPIKAVADLKGRKIATGKGSIGHYLLLRLLAQAHLKPSDVQVVYLAPGDAKAALSSGAVDAWSTWSPYVGLEVLHGGGRVVANGVGVLNVYGFQAASDASIRDKRPQLADFLHRLTVAQQWEKNHLGDYATVLSKETGLPWDVAFDMLSNYRPVTVPMTPAIVQEERNVLQLFADDGVIAAVPPTDGAFDFSFNAPVGNPPAGH